MTGNSPTLIELLHLLDGRLPAPAAERVRTALQRNAVAQERWQLLVQACSSPIAPGDAHAHLGNSDVVTAEELAAYVEGALTEEETRRIETHLWESPGLLQEARQILRYCQTPNGVPSPPPLLRSRLLELWDRGEESAATELAVPALRFTEPSNKRARVRRTARRRTPAWLWFAAAGAAAAVVLLVVGDRLRNPGRQRPLAQPTEQERPSPNRPSSEKRPGSAAGAKRRVLPAPNRAAANLDSDKLPPIPQPTLADQQENPNLEPAMPAPVDVLDEQPIESYLPQEATPVVLSWKRALGLVAALDQRRDRWMGVQSAELRAPDVYVALSRSWAEAEREAWGQLVLGEDTKVSIVKPAAKEQQTLADVQVRLQFGKIGLRAIPSGAKIAFASDVGSAQLVAAEDGTTITATSFAGDTQLTVVQGRVTLGSTSLGRGSARRWRDGRWQAAAVDDPTPKWLTSPVGAVRLPASQQKNLLISDDVKADLGEIRARVAPGVARVMTQWQLAIMPQDTILETLRSRDARERATAIHWLLSRPLQDPQARAAYRALAKAIGETAIVRRLAQSIHYLQLTGHMPLDLAQWLVRGLNHPEPAVRSLSYGLLATLTKTNVAYDPHARPEVRARSMALWSQVVRRYYAAHNGRKARPSATRH